MFQRHYEKNRGVILLVNVLIISSIILLLAASLIIFSLYSFKSSTAFMQQNQALALNLSCAEEALWQIQQSSGFTGNGQLIVDNRKCDYNIENTGGENRKIKVSSTISAVVAKTLILLSVNASSTISIQSWKEVGDF